MESEAFKIAYEHANSLLGQSRYSEAEEAFMALLDRSPNSAAVCCKLGELHSNTNRLSTALLYFNHAALLNPRIPWPLIGRAEVYVAEGNVDLAISEYRQVIADFPEMNHINHKIALLESSRVSKATSRHDHESYKALFEEANNLVKRRQHEKAEAIYRELLTTYPASAALLCKLGSVIAWMERYDEAKVCFDRAIELEPNNPWSYVAMGDLYGTISDWVPALDYYERAESINPDQPRLLHRLLRARKHVKRLMADSRDIAPSSSQVLPDLPGNVVTPRLSDLSHPINIVFFWKQNDSELYGRRQDMLVKYLRASPEIGAILHFDAAISLEKIESMSDIHAPVEDRQIAAYCISRFLGLRDLNGIYRRVFIYGNPGDTLMGRPLMTLEDYPSFVQSCLQDVGITDNLLAWVCPVTPYFPEIQERLDFSFVVTDVIDDQRQWQLPPSALRKITESYLSTYRLSDLVFANCRSVQEWASGFAQRVSLVPNGCEIHSDIKLWAKPDMLGLMKGPIIGYAGNMVDRIDFLLLEHLVHEHQDYNFIFIGRCSRSTEFEILRSCTNVHFLGVIPYEMTLRYLAWVDVAIVPHTICPMTDNMNPLKLFIYRSLGLPVVSTRIANITDAGAELYIADDHNQFARHVEDLVKRRFKRARKFPSPKQLSGISWNARVRVILEAIKLAWMDKNQSSSESEKDD